MPAMDPESWHRLALVTDVPGDIATGIATGAVGLGVGAVTALWRRLVKVEDRARADKAEAVKALTEATLSIRAAAETEKERTELWRRTYSLLERIERRLDERAS